MQRLSQFKVWVKRRETPMQRGLYRVFNSLLRADVSPIPALHVPLHQLIRLFNFAIFRLVRIYYWKPVFLCRLANKPKRLHLDGRGIPHVTGPVKITLGDKCRLSTQISIAGRNRPGIIPELVVGDNVGLGWQTGVYVGSRILIGNNVRLGGQGALIGYPGHPLDADARARGEPDTEDQVRDIVLEDDVWLGRGVIVNAGVTIGRGTIVGAGSVVTKDLPAGVLAGGAPAKVIRRLDQRSTDVDMPAPLKAVHA